MVAAIHLARTMQNTVAAGQKKESANVIQNICRRIAKNLATFAVMNQRVVGTRTSTAKTGQIKENALVILPICICPVEKLATCVRPKSCTLVQTFSAFLAIRYILPQYM